MMIRKSREVANLLHQCIDLAETPADLIEWGNDTRTQTAVAMLIGAHRQAVRAAYLRRLKELQNHPSSGSPAGQCRARLSESGRDVLMRKDRQLGVIRSLTAQNART